jgi:hypothetical protein
MMQLERIGVEGCHVAGDVLKYLCRRKRLPRYWMDRVRHIVVKKRTDGGAYG